ncbi:MAG TPA: YebC/PmpR family DNA-binding transcriptional regulator [Candidatus Paceibacterota bacterium]
MSGHNKWSQIVRQKGAEDAKRSKLFSMLGRQISIQSRMANGDVNSPGLRKALEIARKANMPKEPIERAIARGTGVGGAALEEVMYEAFGPGGAAFIITGITDSKNRTSNEVKQILNEHESSLGGPGSSMWAFTSSRNEEGEVVYTPTSTLPLSENDGKKLGNLMAALEDHDDVRGVFTNAT